MTWLEFGREFEQYRGEAGYEAVGVFGVQYPSPAPIPVGYVARVLC